MITVGADARRRRSPDDDAPTSTADAGHGGAGRVVDRASERLAEVPGPVVAAGVAVCYVAAAQYVIWLNDPVNAGAGYWPAAGLTLVALLLLPVRRWGWVLGAIVVAEIGGDAVHGYPLEASIWWAAGNAVEPVVAALLLRRFGAGGRLAPLGALVPFLVAGVLLGPLVGATVGSVGTALAYDVSQLDVLLKWWAGDGLGVLVVAPLLLCFRQPAIAGRTLVDLLAPAAVAVAITLLTYRDLGREWDVAMSLMIFPVLMVVGVRLGLRGVAVIGFIVAELASFGLALGFEPFGLVSSSSSHAITLLQVFLATALGTALVMATIVHDTIERTRQYERQRSVADAFQAAALPERLPTVPGLSLAARYAAASTDRALHIGGDWYDAFPLGPSATAVVIGDVAGHDLTAAVVMGQLRNGLRSVLIEVQDPSLAMAAMDRQLAALPTLTLATVIIAVYSEGQLSWTNAGHPPMLHRPVGGPARYLVGSNRLLGLGDARYDTHHIRLDDGDLVVAFTDGVIEHRSWTLDLGFDHLAGLLTDAASRDPEVLCDLLLDRGLQGRPRDDDACIVVVRQDDDEPRARSDLVTEPV